MTKVVAQQRQQKTCRRNESLSSVMATSSSSPPSCLSFHTDTAVDATSSSQQCSNNGNIVTIPSSSRFPVHHIHYYTFHQSFFHLHRMESRRKQQLEVIETLYQLLRCDPTIVDEFQ
eukprot:CAMPEP_0116564924 /NCGR_PEP_ID=MMETSP0397-20121206/13609_1 /TAXON_ID=216820 /ORGANISM="Cyclophora tenuis, Strain ECT3854" /LENGTH=116 /DNA_ID=CAMNT_0004091633 /DNA_START=270 /DNA_END=620 /DNA_ORIENTATION=+